MGAHDEMKADLISSFSIATFQKHADELSSLLPFGVLHKAVQALKLHRPIGHSPITGMVIFGPCLHSEKALKAQSNRLCPTTNLQITGLLHCYMKQDIASVDSYSRLTFMTLRE